MAASKCEISRCGLCRFYDYEGRRGGTCSQLNVPVGSQWRACYLGASPFLATESTSERIKPEVDRHGVDRHGVDRHGVALSQVKAGISNRESLHEPFKGVKPTEASVVESVPTEKVIVENPVLERPVGIKPVVKELMSAAPENAIAQPKVAFITKVSWERVP